MATGPLMQISPAMEAQLLLHDVTEITARDLATGIAALPYAVGMGLAPDPSACRAAADKICRKFSGAVLAAVEFEREIAALGERQAREDAMRAALEWYAEQTRLCRLIHSEGDPGRNALSADGGKRARDALHPDTPGVAEMNEAHFGQGG